MPRLQQVFRHEVGLHVPLHPFAKFLRAHILLGPEMKRVDDLLECRRSFQTNPRIRLAPVWITAFRHHFSQRNRPRSRHRREARTRKYTRAAASWVAGRLFSVFRISGSRRANFLLCFVRQPVAEKSTCCMADLLAREQLFDRFSRSPPSAASNGFCRNVRTSRCAK